MRPANKSDKIREVPRPDSREAAVSAADYRLLFDSIPDPYLVLDPKLRIVAVNDAYLRVEGMEAGADDYLIKPFSSRELLARVKAHLELARMRREKDLLLIQQSRMAAMGEMIGNIAHQWRQPLNVLGLKVQELGLSVKYGDFSEELLNDNIAKAMEIVQHLSKTITVFQDFLKSEKEKISFKVNQVIAKAVSLVDDGYKNQNICIDISTKGDPQINGYPSEYSQVLLNLLANARDAFFEHGVTNARITVHSWAENDKTVVTVTDNAGGIDEGIIDKIFDAYFTTIELGKGTGVGLFIAKMIIETNMGGRLSVRNVEGGAEFRIEV